MSKIKLPPEISGYLWKLTDDMRVLELLEFSLGRVLGNAASRGAFAMGLVDMERAIHIRDWLAAAVANDEPWLSLLDDQKRPRKLMKFGTVDAIVAEADKAMDRYLRNNIVVELREGDEELFCDLDDGYRLVRLLTPEALDRESAEMQHCVGQGAYDGVLSGHRTLILSLRDRFGKAHATVEVNMDSARGPVVVQCFGKQNSAPIPFYGSILGKAFREKGVRVGQLGQTVYDTDWNAYLLTDLPAGLRITGDLHLRNLDGLVLPETLVVNGDLYCERCEGISLPSVLTVSGVVYMTGGSVSVPAEWMTAKRVEADGVDTPNIGISGLIRARSLKINGLRNWTTVGGMLVDSAVVDGCGVSVPQVMEANERTAAARIEQNRTGEAMPYLTLRRDLPGGAETSPVPKPRAR